MNRRLSTVAVALALGFSAAAFGTLAKDEMQREQDRINADVNANKQACDTRSGNAKDICMAEAKGNEKVAKAELEARHKGTVRAREDAALARADANYNVAKQRCDAMSGNAKDVCRKDAQAASTKAKADANLAAKTADVRQDALEQISDAQDGANRTKRAADYKSTRERCYSLAGAAKDTCETQAKTKYGM